MFKNDRMMTIFTGLILAVFAGTMVQYGDRFMAMISGESQIQTSDDFYSVRAGSSQMLDVLANDEITGPIVVLDQPQCGSVSLSGGSLLRYSSDSSCTGEITFSYCVDSVNGCSANSVTLNVIAIAMAQSTPEPVQAQDPDIAESDPEPAPQDQTDVPEQQIDTAPAEAALADETAPDNTAPVVVVVTQPEPEPVAPEIDNIIISMQAPILVAPNIDEFVTPNAAIAAIRQQTAILDNSATNTDNSIATQSSGGTVAPVEFGVANFGAPLTSENSDVIIGGTDTRQVVVAVSPQLTNIPPEANPVTAPLERGPFVVAELPAETAAKFGEFDSERQNSSDLLASFGTRVFVSPDNETEIANIEPGQAELLIEQSGPTALIALQLSGTDFPREDFESGNPQLLTLQGEQSFIAQHEAPVTLTASALAISSPIVLGREPDAITDGPEFAGAQAWLETNSRLSGILTAAPLYDVNIVSVDPLANANATTGFAQQQQSASSGDLMVLTFGTFDQQPLFGADSGTVFMAGLGNGDAGFQSTNPIAGFETSTDLAGLLPQIDKSVASPLQIAPVIEPEQTELASLETENLEALNPITSVPQLSTCEIFLDPSVRSGANVLLFLIAECKPEMPVTISHAGLEFTILTDASGTANVLVPAMQRTAEITASFADGSSASTVALVTQITEVTRAGVSWRGDADLDLHAFEYGAVTGEDGHVWAGSARDYRSARLKGGGYLVELGDKTIEGGALAEVYSMPLGRSVVRGTVTMTLEVNNGGTVCGTDISAQTVRTRPDNSAGLRRIRFSVPDCGGGALAQFRVTGAVDDIRLAAQ